MWRSNFIAVDWGTTNRRAWLVNPSGHTIDQFADALGIMSIPQGGFQQAAAEIRKRLGDYPMLLAGMVGSNKGWQTVPYLNCPVDAQMLADQILWVEPLRTGIISGVCQRKRRADVMRGEEVQAIGAMIEDRASQNAYICHPGTHTKWIRLNQGKIDKFQTAMTGEIFNLLRTNSILSSQMDMAVTDGAAFHDGLDEVSAGVPLLSALFSVRAQYLLERQDDGASFASGLLIGCDVQAGLAQADVNETITIIGRSDLCHLYKAAIEYFGFKCQTVDGEQAFLSGIKAIIQHLQRG